MTFEYNPYSRGRVIKRMRDKGFTYVQIAEEFGLSPQRIQQICNAKYKEEQANRKHIKNLEEAEAYYQRAEFRFLLPILPQLKEFIK